MARFQVSTSKKRYLKGKRVYKYRRISLNVPTRLFKVIEPYLKEQMQVYATSEDGILEIKFTNRKNK